MEVVMPLSHRVIVLDYGERIADGPPEQVVHDERVIQAYLGDRFRARS
jgi:branched-chain amino acid transport system ATP-binding protein